MDRTNESIAATTRAPTLKPCPFCGDTAVVVQGADGRFAVQCKGCRCSTARSNQSAELAAMWWQIRLGTPSYLGGTATKGIKTVKKAEASRKNLELARQAKKLKQQETHSCVGEACQSEKTPPEPGLW